MISVYARAARFVSLMALLPMLLVHSSRAQAAPKEWSLLVFLNGHNNLDSFGTYNINQMEKYGSTDKINLVVQWASASHETTRRLLVQKDADPATVTSPVVEDLPRVDMGDPKSLVEFVKWGAEKYPAQNYFVVVWNHGSGWHRDARGNVVRDISHDEFSGHLITTEQLGVAINEASQAIKHRINIYGSDACLMQMMEVNGQMTNSVDFVVASQEVEPGDGWPYDLFLRNWIALKEATPQNVGKALVDAYHEYYTEKGDSNVTLSIVDLEYQADITKAMGLLAQSLTSLSATELAPLATNLYEIQNFYYSDYSDVSHMVEIFAKYGPAKIKPQLLAVDEAFKRYVVHSRVTGTTSKARGVSIWLPKYAYEIESYGERYAGLSFSSQTGWKNTLAKLLNARF